MYDALEKRTPKNLRPVLRKARPFAANLLKRFPGLVLLWESLSNPVNKGYRRNILLTLIKWHLVCRPLKRPLVCQINDQFATTVFPDSDSGVLNLYTRGVDLASTAFVRAHLAPGDFFIDVGCNVGNRAVVLSDLARGGILIDANPLCIERARENFKLNGISTEDYLFVAAACGSKEGTARFINLGGTNTCSRISELGGEKSASLVPVVTVDRIVQLYGNRPRFLKIDAEGCDLEVLKGAVETLKEGTLRLVKFERFPTIDTKLFVSFFESVGWEVFAISDTGEPTSTPSILDTCVDLYARPKL